MAPRFIGAWKADGTTDRRTRLADGEELVELGLGVLIGRPLIGHGSSSYGLLLGLDDDPTSRMRTAIVSAAVGGSIVHPLVADLDDGTLRTELLAVTRKLFDLPD